MIITYHQKSFIKLQTGDTVIALGPIAKTSKFKSSSFGVDLAMVPMHTPEYSGIDAVTYNGQEPFIIDGPGEYEIGGIMVRGFSSGGMDEKGTLNRINTMYTFQFDGMNIWYLGALADGEIPLTARQAIGDVDVLFVPIGGKSVLDPQVAHKLAVSFGPKVIIPMDYGSDQESDALKQFLKSANADKVTPVDKLTIKSRDLAGKSAEVVVME
jgi:L-ascorbate metabolism protein UlaG (beta-lactamase superfamily)